jgi:hexosaminidase
MTLSFTARIEGKQILCRIGSTEPVSTPVFCFSLMAPPRVVSGGVMIRQVAGYGEVALPDIPAGGAVEVVLAHQNPAYGPRNRAWLPLGGYLRTAEGCLPLPKLEAGVREAPMVYPETTGLRLIPAPLFWQAKGQQSVASGLNSDDSQVLAVDTLARRLGLAPLVQAGGVPLRVELLPGAAEGAYDLDIAPDQVTLRAADDTGRFHAAITLLNLRETHGALPCGHLEDAPRFGWRGQHLDCARHFYAVETILRLLNLMALFKLNRFHWHFADDEAFRLEVDSLPDLWRKTAFRGEGELVPGVFGGGIRAGGSYSKADVAKVLARAKDLHIDVLPEIEIPAHAFAFNKAVPGLRDRGDNGPELSVQGYAENILNPAVPKTFEVVTPLMLEVAGMFPMKMLHLGCDELPSDAWAGSPAVTALKAREGLKDRDDVQGWMMERLAAELAANGIRPAGWEEAIYGSNGGIGHDAVLFSWTGQGAGIDAARRGHDVVMCPAQNVYFDIAHSDDPDDWGATWAGITPLETVVSWQPVPKGAEDVAARIIGVQGCFWSEFTTEDAEMEPMLAPRILGLATKAWDRADSMTGSRLRELAGAYAPLFDRIGWRRHRGA